MTTEIEFAELVVCPDSQIKVNLTKHGRKLNRFLEFSHRIQVKRRSSEDITKSLPKLKIIQIPEHSYEQF